MQWLKLFIPFLAVILTLSVLSPAQAQRFALVAKSVDDGNFRDAWAGCSEAAKRRGDECVLLGPRGEANSRLQLQSIEAALENDHYDGFAISVTNSKLIGRAVQKIKVPVITFDSPFTDDEKNLSRGYIGVDNIEFGRNLARVAKAVFPDGGSVCLMTASHDTNLALRVLGVRQELSGDLELPAGRKLHGEGGWRESARCPWDSGDNIGRAQGEVRYTLETIKPDALISVGWWPVVDSQAYRKTVQPFIHDLQTRKTLVIAGVGKVIPEFRALLDERLVHGFVSIDFFEIGRLTYAAMKEAAGNAGIPVVTYTPTVIEMVK